MIPCFDYFLPSIHLCDEYYELNGKIQAILAQEGERNKESGAIGGPRWPVKGAWAPHQAKPSALTFRGREGNESAQDPMADEEHFCAIVSYGPSALPHLVATLVASFYIQAPK
jgi:hypothetical protein